MSFFPLRKIPGLSWPEVPAGQLCSVWGMYLELERTQWLSPEEISAGQLAQVRALLAHCSQHVPYYHDLLRSTRIKPAAIQTMDDFRRLPILKRQTYQEQFPRLQARRLPAGMFKTNEDDTSGTSGIAINVWQTNLVNLWWLACYLRDLHWSNIDPRGSLAAIRIISDSRISRQEALRGFKSSCWSTLLETLLETGPLFLMNIQQDPRRQLEWLLRVQPNYLQSHTSNLEVLASLLQESGQRLSNLRAVQSYSETVSEEAQHHIEAAFGAPVKNLYSCTEAGYVASPCPEGHGLHVHSENVLLEVLDDNDQPCAPGATGRVVLTTLHNFLTPFIRYDILDAVTLGSARCSCGRGLPLLTRVHGKLRPLFRLADGRHSSSAVVINRLGKLKIYHQYQLIQRAVDHIVVRLVPNQRWTDESAPQVVQIVQECLAAPVHVEIQLLERLQMTAGGKLRAVVIE